MFVSSVFIQNSSKTFVDSAIERRVHHDQSMAAEMSDLKQMMTCPR